METRRASMMRSSTVPDFESEDNSASRYKSDFETPARKPYLTASFLLLK
jgi:hypothetical protein